MRRDYLLILLLGILLFVPFLGSVHLFDWDEINFAECAREMLLTGDWFRPQIDFQPFWEKPPFFLWLQAISMHIFGVNEFAARFPNAICGIATLLIVYHIGARLHDRLFGWLWVLAWIGSLLPHLYFHSGIIDPWFNLLIFISIYGFIEFRWQFFSIPQAKTFWMRYRFLLLGGGALGLAILTKGPAAYLIAFLVLLLYWARYKFKNKGYAGHILLFSAAAALPAVLWFGAEIALHGTTFVEQFIVYQIRLFSTEDAGHGGFFGYHALVLLLGCFPISVFALPNLWGDRQSEDELLESHTLDACKRSDFGTWMQLMFWVVLVLFSLVQTKIVHYSSLAYFPLTYLGSVTIWRALHWDVKPVVSKWLLPALGILLGLVGAAIPFIGQHPGWLMPFFVSDEFAQANLSAEVPWEWWHGLPGVVLLAATLFAWRRWNQSRIWEAAQHLFIGGTVFAAGTLLLCARNIEAYSQRAAVEFYESLQSEHCVVKTVGFKSYAHLFYGDKKPCCARDSASDQDKVYLVAKISDLGDLPTRPDCREIGRKNGFVFFEHVPGDGGR